VEKNLPQFPHFSTGFPACNQLISLIGSALPAKEGKEGNAFAQGGALLLKRCSTTSPQMCRIQAPDFGPAKRCNHVLPLRHSAIINDSCAKKIERNSPVLDYFYYSH
jgi:hypothetical protein